LTKTRHFDKITAFTAFDENHGFRDFCDYLLSLHIINCNHTDIPQGTSIVAGQSTAGQ